MSRDLGVASIMCQYFNRNNNLNNLSAFSFIWWYYLFVIWHIYSPCPWRTWLGTFVWQLVVAILWLNLWTVHPVYVPSIIHTFKQPCKHTFECDSMTAHIHPKSYESCKYKYQQMYSHIHIDNCVQQTFSQQTRHWNKSVCVNDVIDSLSYSTWQCAH